MRNLYKTSLLAGAMLAPIAAGAVPTDIQLPAANAASFRHSIESRSAFQNRRALAIEQINNRMYGNKSMLKEAASDNKPMWEFEPASVAGDLDAPNGERWYYTGDYTYESIQHEYFTEYILKSFRFTVYNAAGETVGTVEDIIHYAQNESRVVSCELTPTVTRNFFNTDDKYEICIGLAINTDTAGVNHYRTAVYSIGGDKEDGYDKIVRNMDSFIGDVVEGSATADGRDNFFITFTEDRIASDEEMDNMTFWEYLNTYHIALTTYGRTEDNAVGPRVLMTKDIPLLNLPGNQESCPFIISFVHDSQVYILVQSLEQPLWEEYNDPIYEETIQRAENTLNIEFYKATQEEITLDYTTPVKVTKKDDPDVYATYFSVGDMRYKDDIVFGEYNQPAGKAALYITKEDYYTKSDSSVKSYYVYGSDGNPILTLATDTESTLSLSDIEGAEPQQLFIVNEGDNYRFSFVNLISGEEAFRMTNYLDITPGNEPLALRANLDRTPAGDSYEYAIECSYPLLLDNGHNLMQVAWLNADGTFNRIEYADMGTDVQYAQIYIEKDALRPGAFEKDGGRAYLLLIKRGNAGEVLREELLIATATSNMDEEGRNLMLLGPDEKGALRSIIPDFTGEKHTLTVYYQTGDTTGDTKYTMVIYDLPLESAAIDEIIGDDSLLTTGETMVFNAQGVLVARGADNLNSLSAGVYVVVSGNSVKKVLVK